MRRARTTISPFKVDYNDLINQAKNSLEWMVRNHPRMIAEKKIREWDSQHMIAVQQGIVRLMERFKKNPQADLFEEFKNINI